MAKNTITRRIELEGGDAVISQLRQLGVVGKDALEKVQSAANQVTGPSAEFTRKLVDIQNSLKSLGTGFNQVGKSIRQFGQEFSIISGVAAGVVLGLGAITKSAADAADAMDKSAQKAGVSIETFAKLQFAAEQNDVATEQLAVSLNFLNKNIDAAVQGGGEAASAFRRLGVDLKASNGGARETEAIFLDLVDAFSKMEDGPQKTALALKVFGRSGAALIPLLNETRAGVQGLFDDVTRLGLGFTSEQAKIGDAFGDSLNLMVRAIKGLKDQIGLIFAPALTAIATGITEFIARNRETIIGFVQGIIDTFNALPASVQTALITIGTVLGGLVILLGPLLVGLGLFIQLIGFAFSGLSSLVVVFSGLSVAVTSFSSALVALGPIIGTIIAFMGSWAFAIGALVAATVALAIIIVKNWDQISSAITGAIASIIGWLGRITGAASAAADAIAGVLTDAFDTLFTKAKSVLKSILEWLGDIIGKAAAAAKAITGVGKGSGNTGGGGGLAGGGLVRGGGSETSDSIPARLSRNEWVMRAKAVRKYGVGFMQAVNTLSFAGGGLVTGMGATPAPIVAATGDRVSSMTRVNSINLHIGDQVFRDLQADDKTAAAIYRYTTGKRLARTGSPSWKE